MCSLCSPSRLSFCGVHLGRQSIRGLVCATAVTLVAPAARAQDAPAPTPTPPPIRTPSIITLPGVVPERYSLPGTTVPVQAPPLVAVPSPTPSARAAPTRIGAPRAERQPASAPRRIVEVSAPTRVPTATATPTPVEKVAVPPAQSIVTRAPARVAEQPAMPGWLWMLIGAGATVLLAGGAWLVLRRRGNAIEEEVPVVESSGPAPRAITPPAPSPAPIRTAPPLARPRSDPFDIGVRPARIELGERDVALDFELLIANRQAEPAEAVRLSLAMMSASPDQDLILAGFHRGLPGETAGEPFDLAPGGGIRMPVRLMLPRERVHVVQVRGRPMFVAMALVDLRWRSGLSIRRFGTDFMIGTAGQGDKLGPIWLDRGQPGPLSVTRYVPREAAAA